MPCTEYEDLIVEYCEDALAESERGKVELHLGVCPECRSFFEIQRELEQTLARAIGKPAPSPMFRRNVMRRVEAENRRPLGWLLALLDVIGYSSVAAFGGVVLSVTVDPLYAGWALLATYAAAGMWLGIYVLREGRLPGQR